MSEGTTFPWSITEEVSPKQAKKKVANGPASSNDMLIKAIKQKIDEIRNYTPKIGVLGDTGVGKSSLCNALFGEKIAKVGMVEACTRVAQEINISGTAPGKGGLTLIDMPGLGEDKERTGEYMRMYKELHPKLDVVLWVMDASMRNYATGIRAYDEIFKADLKRCPVVFVMSQADRVNPAREWDLKKQAPGSAQKEYLKARRLDVAEKFDVSPNKILAVSADTGFNVAELVDLIVKVVPNEKKFSVVREAREENVSKAAATAATKGLWDTIKDLAGSAWDKVGPTVVEYAVPAIKKGLMSLGKKFLPTLFV